MKIATQICGVCVLGSTLLCGDAALAAQPSGTTSVAGQTEVSRLVDLAAQRLHVRVEYDPAQLKGAVTVRGAGDGGIPDSELWESVNLALTGRGFTTVLSTKLGSGTPSFTVVRLTDAAGLVLPEGPFTDNRPTWSTPAPGYAAVFFKLSNRTTKVAAELIKPLLSKTGSSATPVGESDLLLVADVTPRLALVSDFLHRIDQPQAQTEVTEVALSHVSPGEVLAFVKDLGARRDASNPRPPGDVLQQPGSNSVLVLAPKEHLQFWKDLIAKIDTRQPLETRNYTSRQVEAKSLAKLVEQVAGVEGGPARGPDGAGGGTKVIVDEFTGTLIVTATASQHARISDLLTRIDATPGGPPKQSKTYPIRNRPVKEIVTVLTELLGQGKLDNTSPLLPRVDGAAIPAAPTRRPEGAGDGSKKDADKPQLTCDEGTNTLIVIGEPRVLGQVEELLKTLDVRQPQVMIEVAMISLTDGQSRQLGVELDKLTTLADGTGRLSSIFSSTSGGGGPSGNPGTGFTASYINVGDFSAVIRALEVINDGRSTSVPSVLVGNNQQASFSSVAQQPTGSVSTDTTSTTTRGFGGFQDAGTRINVKPQIAEGDHLVLTYNVELSSFTSNPTADGLPGARQQNTVSSVAMIPDGHAVVVGGIELNSDTDDTSRVPLFGEVPLIGWLFRSSKVTHDRTRFFVLIKANVMRDEGFADLKYVSGRTVEANDLRIDDGTPKVEPRIIR